MIKIQHHVSSLPSLSLFKLTRFLERAAASVRAITHLGKIVKTGMRKMKKKKKGCNVKSNSVLIVTYQECYSVQFNIETYCWGIA